jgi:hypothetical protein
MLVRKLPSKIPGCPYAPFGAVSVWSSLVYVILSIRGDTDTGSLLT